MEKRVQCPQFWKGRLRVLIIEQKFHLIMTLIAIQHFFLEIVISKVLIWIE